MATYDIGIEITDPVLIDAGLATKPFTFGDTTVESKYMTGFYKTIIKWTKCFLTIPGTDISDSGYGTTLASLIGQNSMDPTTIRDVAYLSVDQATAKIRQYQNRALNFEDNELLSSVRVLEFGQDTADTIQMTVEFHNVANERMIIRLPLDLTASRAS